MKIISFCVFMGLVGLCLCIPGCGSQAKIDTVASLQQKIPFTLILPKYFPKGIDPSGASATGPQKDLTIPDADVLIVSINYGKAGTDPSISIKEENNETMFMQSNPSTITLDINGSMILEDQRETSKPTQHLEYNWNYRGININVLIYGYDKVECEKIIGSMIPPL